MAWAVGLIIWFVILPLLVKLVGWLIEQDSLTESQVFFGLFCLTCLGVWLI